MLNRIKTSDFTVVDHEQNGIPVVLIQTLEELNRTVGYASYINSLCGPLLYRGQNDIYDSLDPSALRNNENNSAIEDLQRNLGFAIKSDHFLTQVFGKEPPDSLLDNWYQYRKVALECLFQHYGAKTTCVDFVDNHWTALWFASHKYNKISKRYEEMPKESNCYLLLYSSEPGVSLGGLTIGNSQFTVDLRKVLSSLFLRPVSQHGWAVKSRTKNIDFNSHIVGIIQMKVSDVLKWLGGGELCTERNFFPRAAEHYDSGFLFLLSSQKGSRYFKNSDSAILSKGFLQDFGC